MFDEIEDEDEEAAEELLDTGQYEKALALLNRMIEREPFRAEAYATRGQAYLHLDEFEKALADFDRALDLSPSDAQALAGRGETLHLLGRYDEALADLDRAAVLDPADGSIFALRGEVQCALERYDAALDDYSRALEFESRVEAELEFEDEDEEDMEAESECCATEGADVLTYVSTLASRGQVYRVLDRYEEALGDLNRAIEQDPQYAWAFAERGETYRLMGQYGKAFRDFSRAIELDPDEDWALSKRAELHLSFRRLDPALEDLDLAISIDPDDWYLYLRGLAYRLLDRDNRARGDLEDALARGEEKLALASNGGRHAMNLATYHLALGNADEAESRYRRAVEQGASPTVIRETVGDLDDFLHLFPDHPRAAELRDLLAGSLNIP
jgi:tetratricopeptide (TPR) repeat protein